jgi:hypothetical protein
LILNYGKNVFIKCRSTSKTEILDLRHLVFKEKIKQEIEIERQSIKDLSLNVLLDLINTNSN